MSIKYSTSTNQTSGFFFTVITPETVYRVRAKGYPQVRGIFEKIGVEILGIERENIPTDEDEGDNN